MVFLTLIPILIPLQAHDAEVGEEVERLRAEQADAQASQPDVPRPSNLSPVRTVNRLDFTDSSTPQNHNNKRGLIPAVRTVQSLSAHLSKCIAGRGTGGAGGRARPRDAAADGGGPPRVVGVPARGAHTSPARRSGPAVADALFCFTRLARQHPCSVIKSWPVWLCQPHLNPGPNPQP